MYSPLQRPCLFPLVVTHAAMYTKLFSAASANPFGMPQYATPGPQAAARTSPALPVARSQVAATTAGTCRVLLSYPTLQQVWSLRCWVPFEARDE